MNTSTNTINHERHEMPLCGHEQKSIYFFAKRKAITCIFSCFFVFFVVQQSFAVGAVKQQGNTRVNGDLTVTNRIITSLFTLGAVQITATGTEINYLSGLSGPLTTLLGGKVDTTTTINSYPLSSNVTLDADDLADGSTNAIITLTQETNFETAYTHSQVTTGNPHSVTKADVNLGSADNTSDLDKPVSTATQTALDAKVTGPASATDSAVAQFDGTTGKLLKDGLTVGTSANNLVQLDGSARLPAVDGSQLTNLPGGSGIDNTAIHKDTAAEISTITEKAAPVSADLIIIEDSADSNNKKKVQIGNLPTGSDSNAVHVNTASEISAVTEKVSPVSADMLLIEDSADSNAKKMIQIGNLPVGVSSHSELTNVEQAGTGVTDGHISDTTQTIYGVKTFNSFPVMPSSDPTTDYQAATKKYVDDTTYLTAPGSVSDEGTPVHMVSGGFGGNDTYTKLLLHGDATPVVDSSSIGQTVSNSSVTIDTTNKKFGAGALNFGSSTYLTVSPSSDWSLGSNFTIDMWVRTTSLGGMQKIISTRGYNDTGYEFVIDGSGYLRVERFPGGSVTGSNTLLADTWYHIAFTYDGTNLKFYINGTLDSTHSISFAWSTANNLRIGNPEPYDEQFYGQIDELRISKGIVRWTTDFTPPTQAYALPENVYSTSVTAQTSPDPTYKLFGRDSDNAAIEISVGNLKKEVVYAVGSTSGAASIDYSSNAADTYTVTASAAITGWTFSNFPTNKLFRVEVTGDYDIAYGPDGSGSTANQAGMKTFICRYDGANYSMIWVNQSVAGSGKLIAEDNGYGLDNSSTNRGTVGTKAVSLEYSNGGSATGATGDYSFTVGTNNLASGLSSVSIGESNTSSGSRSFTAGSVNEASGGHSIAFGNANTASGGNATITGGYSNTASAIYSIIPGGGSAVANKYGQFAHAAGYFSTAGDAQFSRLTARNATTDATETTLYLDGVDDLLTVPSNAAWAFTVRIVGKVTGSANSIHHEWKGTISNNGGTVAIQGTASQTVVHEYDAAIDTSVTADDTNDALKITVTGIAATNIRWVAIVELAQVIY